MATYQVSVKDANARVMAALIAHKLQHGPDHIAAKRFDSEPLPNFVDAKHSQVREAKSPLIPHLVCDAPRSWEAITKALLRQQEANLPMVQIIIRSMRQLRERHVKRITQLQICCTCCGVFHLHQDLDENRCEACDTTSLPVGLVQMRNTGVPLSAFRQMGLKGWWCSPEDASFAKTMQRISCTSEAYYGELEELADESEESAEDLQICSRARTVNHVAFSLMREDGEDQDELELECDIEEDLDELDCLLDKLHPWRGFLSDAVSRKSNALRERIQEELDMLRPDVWVSEDIYNRVEDQGWAKQVARDFDGYD